MAGKLYITKEGRGLWKYNFSPSSGGSVKGQVYIPPLRVPLVYKPGEEQALAMKKIKAAVAELNEVLAKS